MSQDIEDTRTHGDVGPGVFGCGWEDRQLDISDAQDEVTDGSNASVQRDARKSLPTLAARLGIARRILMRLKR